MIPYMVGELALNSSHLTRELVKYVPCRGYFRAAYSQNGDKFVTSPSPPPTIERVPREKVEVTPGVAVGSLTRFRAALIEPTQGLPRRRRLRR